MSQKGKVESGSELLARLGPRPSLRGLEVWTVLGFEPCSGDIVEVCGGEGVGKTELLLHLATSTLLSCHGDRPEVIWVDCDLKFSVLRLAVLLEQQLMKKASGEHCCLVSGEHCCSASKTSTKSAESVELVVNKDPQNIKPCCDLVGGGNTESCEAGHLKDRVRDDVDGCCRLGNNRERCAAGCSQHLKSDGKNGTGENTGRTGIKREGKKEDDQRQGVTTPSKAGDNVPHETDHSVKPDSNKKRPLHESDSSSSVTFSEKSKSDRLTSKRKADEMESDVLPDDDRVCHRHDESEATSVNKSLHTTRTEYSEAAACAVESGRHSRAEKRGMSEEEVEKRVEECLRRVHVLRCVSSQQLVCTLHSLHTLIAANRNIALLLIDPLSAFFWSDRASDCQHASSFLQKNMAQVSSVLKDIAVSYGVLVVASKQALLRPRSKASSTLSPARGEDSRAEFLGQAWGRAVTRRLVCSSRRVCAQKGVRTTRYTLSSGSAGQTQFTVGESGVCVV
ncbi:hypothetical protein ACOMHN_055865 [Nucella lapillus]